MNLFILQESPILAARDNCDVHCNKIFLEICGMLANCFSLEVLKLAPKTKSGNYRKHSHYNHPVSKFVRETKGNMAWTITHALELEKERLKAGYKPHFSNVFLNWVIDNLDKSLVPDGERTDFAVAIPEKAECRKDSDFKILTPVEKYRRYYIKDKKFATWKNRTKPEWVK